MFEGIFNKKFLLATAAALAIIIFWDLFFLKDIREKEAIVKQEKTTTLQTTSTATIPTESTGNYISTKQAQDSSKRITINNNMIEGSISLKGARIDDISLVHYQDSLDKNSKHIKIFDFKNTENAYFFESGWIGLNNVETPNSIDATWNSTNTTLTTKNPIVLTWVNKNNVTFKKEISIDENYVLTIKDIIENKGNQKIEVSPFAFILRHNDPDVEDLFISHEGFVGYVNKTLERVDYKDTLEKKHEYNGYSTYLGFTDKYWLSAILLDNKTQITSRFLSFKDSKNINNYQADYKGANINLESGQSTSNITRLFVGPKEYNLINAYNKELNLEKFDDTIDFGWFFFFTKPMIKFLLWIHDIFGNFGLAILLFTVMVRLIILPVAYKSYISMAKMKELQPKMKELKEQYSKDMPRYNKELMSLYKTEKVNPLSGCLPILLQIPIFFSIYKVIFISIELRHTAFWGWVSDMSVMDPTNLFTLFGLLNFNPPSFMHVGIWPILMGLTMFIQQKLSTTQVMDNMQQKIMNMMPIILTFILAPFPAGLVIYWTWSNIISIVQQYFINKKVHKEISLRKAYKK